MRERVRYPPTVQRQKWVNSDKDPIIIPAFGFQDFWTSEYYDAKKGDAIEAIVLRDRHGCESLDLRCKELLRSLNPKKSDVLENPTGRIVVPTLNYFAELKFYGFDLPPLEGDAGAVIKALDDLRRSSEIAVKLRAEAIISALQPIVSNIVTVSGLAPKAATTPSVPGSGVTAPPAFENACARRRSIFGSIGANDWNPAEGGPYLYVSLGVIDSHIDEKHCDFVRDQIHASITPLGDANKLEEAARGECDIAVIPDPKEDAHGTHVAGIIAARSDSKIGSGIYPFTDIYSYELDLSNATAFAKSSENYKY
jgi:hypothetical protein